MRSPLATVTLSVLLISLIGWLLVVGRSLILPFVIALIVWYMINALAHLFARIPLLGRHLPSVVSFSLALMTIFFAGTMVLDIVTVNLTQLAQDAPTYQRRLETLFSEVSSHLHLNDPVELRDLLPESIVPRMVTAGASLVTTLAGSASLVFIYVLFLVLEQSTFDRKLERLFATPERAEAAFAIRAEINRSIMHYFSIKTAVSVATGVLTSLVLIVIGLPYAALFGFIAFLLNYIPTIGSLIGVIFPSLLAAVYYDTLGPFFAIATGLGLIQFTIGNLLEPRLMGSNLNLSGLVIMLSLAFWGAIWGIVGMVLCVPLTVIIVIVCARFESSRPIAVLLSQTGELGLKPPCSAAQDTRPER